MKKSIIITLFLCLLMIGSVSASDANDTLSSGVTEKVQAHADTHQIDKASNNDIKSDGLPTPPSEDTTTDQSGADNNDVITTTDDGTFTSLQNKIDATEAGSTIELENDYSYNNGFNTEGITISKSLTIDGNGKTIDAQGKARIFDIQPGIQVIIENLKFINGKATESLSGGGAIGAESTSNLTINNCVFINNTANYGGGAIYAYDKINLNINNTLFINNTAEGNGGAIFIKSYSKGYILNSNFTNNKAIKVTEDIYGGSIDGGNAINCNFNNNQAIGQYNYGGAIANGNAINCNFTENKAWVGGAIAYSDANNCIFINNTAENGGAIAYGNAIRSTFINNTAKYDGGAMYGGTTLEYTETLCIFENNEKYWIRSIKVPLNASNFTSTLNSGEKLLFNLTYDNQIFDGINITITVTKHNGVFIGNYTALTGKQNGLIVNLPVGIYNATLSTAKYNVKPINITITINEIQSNFTIQDIPNRIVDQKINITLTETNGFNGTVTVKIGEYECNIILNNGKGQTETTIPVNGTYKAILDFKGNENFTKYYTESNQFIISPKTKTKIKYAILNDIEGKLAIDIRVYDETNNEIANSELTLTGNINSTIKTNEVYKPDLNSGEYEIKVIYNENEYYSGNTSTIKLIVVKDPNTTINELEGQIKTLETNLENNITALNQANLDKEELQGHINTLNGQISTLQTNLENNITALNQANEQIKIYNTTIVKLEKQIIILNQTQNTKQNNESNNKSSSSETPNINPQNNVTPAKITKKATKITAKKKTFKSKVKVKKYTATVKSGKKAVAKVTVYLTIKGKKYKKTLKTKTNSKGKATFKIKKLTKKGKYTATITYKGNKKYKQVTTKSKIRIKA